MADWKQFDYTIVIVALVVGKLGNGVN